MQTTMIIFGRIKIILGRSLCSSCILYIIMRGSEVLVGLHMHGTQTHAHMWNEEICRLLQAIWCWFRLFVMHRLIYCRRCQQIVLGSCLLISGSHYRMERYLATASTWNFTTFTHVFALPIHMHAYNDCIRVFALSMRCAVNLVSLALLFPCNCRNDVILNIVAYEMFEFVPASLFAHAEAMALWEWETYTLARCTYMMVWIKKENMHFFSSNII